MHSKPLHILIGPGSLGHGLLGLEHDAAATDLIVAHRTSSSTIARHLASGGPLQVRTADGRLTTITPLACIPYDTAPGRSAIIDLIRGRDQVIITTTVGAGQAAVIAFLSGLPSDLWNDRSVAVIPCENRLDPGWVAFGQSSGTDLFTDVVVDRICTQPDPLEPVVATEDYHEFVVERTGDSRAPELVGATVVDDISYHRRRKLYLVNGLQLATALMAVRLDDDGIDETSLVTDLVAQEFGADVLDGLGIEYLLALHLPFIHQVDPTDALPYLEICKARIAATPDRATRVIFGGSGDPRTWTTGALTKYDTRLTTPLGEYCKLSGTEPKDTMLWLAWDRLKQILDRLE